MKRIIKKTVAILITAALMLSVFAVMGVSAATNPTVTLNYTKDGLADPHITCDMSGYTGDRLIDYMQISISCSNCSLKDSLLNVTNSVDNSSIDFSYSYDTLNNALVFIYEPNTAGDVYIPAGTTELFEFDLNPSSDACGTDLQLVIDTIYCYTNGEDAEVTSNLEMFVPYYGDVNSDGSIDLRDLLRYKLYLAGSTTVFKTGNGDLNADGEYNAEDISLLVQLLLGEISF